MQSSNSDGAALGRQCGPLRDGSLSKPGSTGLALLRGPKTTLVHGSLSLWSRISNSSCASATDGLMPRRCVHTCRPVGTDICLVSFLQTGRVFITEPKRNAVLGTGGACGGGRNGDFLNGYSFHHAK